MEELRIDPEFQGKIPPLTDAEFEQLRENILSAGEVYEPLVTWNGVIVDGHNRWKVIQEHPELPWRSRKMDFADKWAAFDWMYKNQLGRRNLTEAQRTYLVGKMYEARKKSYGGDRKSSMQNANLKSNNGRMIRTDETVAKELGINPSTVDRAAHFARGIDTIRETDPETANAILTGRITPPKQDIRMIGKANETDRAEMIRQVAENKRVTPVSVPEKIEAEKPKAIQYGPTKERETHNKIVEAIETLYDDKPIKFTINDLYDEIRWNAESYIRLLSHTLEDHGQLIEAYKEEVKAYIAENVTMKIKEIEEAL
jgi:hypothetical protein